MSGLPFRFRGHLMLFSVKDRVISLPAVTERRTMDVIIRQLPPELKGAVLRTVAKPIGDDLAGAPTQGDPQPPLLSFAADKRPQLVQLQNIVQLSRQQATRQGGLPLYPTAQPTADRSSRHP